MSKSVPITISISQQDLDSLKYVAQFLSTKNKLPCSYGDIIRDQIQKTITRQWNSIEISGESDPEHDLIRPDREFWTEVEIQEFNQTEFGQKMAECIETEDYKWFVSLFTRMVNKYRDKNSLAMKLFKCTSQNLNSSSVMRDPASVAIVVARRGGVPDSKMEYEEILVGSIKIGFNTTFDSQHRIPWFMMASAGKSAVAYTRELDSDILKYFSRDAFEVVDATSSSFFVPANYEAAIKNIIKHGIIAHHIIMSPDEYVDIHHFGNSFLEAPPLKIALETKDYGHIMGIPVTPSLRCPNNEVYVLSGQKDIGVFIDISRPKVTHQAHPSCDKHGFVCIGEQQTIICNNYAISKMIK